MGKKGKEITIHSSTAEYLIYVAAVGDTVSAINQHLKTVFSDGELEEAAVIKKYLITAAGEEGL